MAIERKELISLDPYSLDVNEKIDRSLGPYQAAFSVYSIRMRTYPDDVRITVELDEGLSFKASSYGIDQTVSNKQNIIQPESPWRFPADTQIRFDFYDQGSAADLYAHILAGIHTGSTVRA